LNTDQSSLTSTFTFDIATASIQQLATLLAEVLCLYLVVHSSGSKAMMASCL